MYDRKFWNWFEKNIGLSFNTESNEKPIIYYAGMTEDKIDANNPEKCKSLLIGLPHDLDFIVCYIVYPVGEELKERKVMIPFTDIEEVLTIKTLEKK